MLGRKIVVDTPKHNNTSSSVASCANVRSCPSRTIGAVGTLRVAHLRLHLTIFAPPVVATHAMAPPTNFLYYLLARLRPDYDFDFPPKKIAGRPRGQRLDACGEAVGAHSGRWRRPESDVQQSGAEEERGAPKGGARKAKKLQKDRRTEESENGGSGPEQDGEGAARQQRKGGSVDAPKNSRKNVYSRTYHKTFHAHKKEQGEDKAKELARKAAAYAISEFDAANGGGPP